MGADGSRVLVDRVSNIYPYICSCKQYFSSGRHDVQEVLYVLNKAFSACKNASHCLLVIALFACEKNHASTAFQPMIFALRMRCSTNSSKKSSLLKSGRFVSSFCPCKD